MAVYSPPIMDTSTVLFGTAVRVQSGGEVVSSSGVQEELGKRAYRGAAPDLRSAATSWKRKS